jgi:hypothetical protein
VPPDVTAGLSGRGDGIPVFNTDLVGIGLDCDLEWPARDIEYSEFRIPRSAAAKVIVLWPPQLPG